jgi:hypothetical protein
MQPPDGPVPPPREPLTSGPKDPTLEMNHDLDAHRAPPPRLLRSLVSWPWLLAMGLFYLGVTVLVHFHKLAGAGVFVTGLLAFHRPLGRLLGGTLVRSWRQLNHDAATARRQNPGSGFDYRPLVVLCASAVFLTLIEYFGDRNIYREAVARWANHLFSNRYYELSSFAYWTFARVAGYVVLPWLVVLAMPGQRLRDFGMSTRGFFKHLWIYGLLFVIVVPAVVMVSYTSSFQHTYPFYKLAGRSWADYLIWEGLYALQFWALEVFFRGFMIHPLKRSMGAYAIFTMVVPYCMIHYHKPLAEVLGAIAAGVVLGTLSLHTGSIWCGVLIHISVAWSMDGLAMIHTVGLPGQHRFVP